MLRRCREKFEKDRGAYLRAGPRGGLTPAETAPASVGAASSWTGWTCPMHPEVRRQSPGDCPSAEWRWNQPHRERRPMPTRSCRHEAAILGERRAHAVVTLAMAMMDGPWVPWVEAILWGSS